MRRNVNSTLSIVTPRRVALIQALCKASFEIACVYQQQEFFIIQKLWHGPGKQ